MFKPQRKSYTKIRFIYILTFVETCLEWNIFIEKTIPTKIDWRIHIISIRSRTREFRITLLIITHRFWFIYYLDTKFEGNPYKKHLFDDLLSNYNRLIRPVQNHSENLTVWIGLKLTQLTEMVIFVCVLLWKTGKKRRWLTTDNSPCNFFFCARNVYKFYNWNVNRRLVKYTKRIILCNIQSANVIIDERKIIKNY